MGFLDLIGSVITGGGFGFIGSIISKGIGIFELVQERKNKALDFQHELALLDKQATLQAAETESELAITQAETAARLREASYSHDTRTGRPHAWVVDILRLIRPILTLMLLTIVWYVYMEIADLSIRAEIIHSILFMAASAVTWWFGDRSLHKSK